MDEIKPMPADTPWWVRMFVDGVSEFYKWLSTWAIAVAASVPLLYEHLPDIKAVISPSAFHYIETGLVLLIFLARIKRQQ